MFITRCPSGPGHLKKTRTNCFSTLLSTKANKLFSVIFKESGYSTTLAACNDTPIFVVVVAAVVYSACVGSRFGFVFLERSLLSARQPDTNTD